ncbi:type II toxin-antitoxin system prevent-host-death family antitoxin [Bosea caraganae]|uniref:Type II toxin-antitoxin system prevent-host-death family antitoxin n=1 Tax=Bosea caraganae TaxID=2763117 RepID=A0A370L3V7_9HYPH|nr:type II toxin-antitoxin system prevent-host-death family antitoxin [Bosea caraganae]RDJ23020.1 type II toxin-antitoxin system prevent-host-death family antitoxin [Bosea caraganae]RDJ28800.1 type II toxin-antitoxin system prevent-host-death family antitoxin [Bosea caraganae]
MKQFRFSDLNRLSGAVMDAAMIEPVALTKHGKEKLVIINAELYRRLVGKTQAYTIENAPDDIHAGLMKGIDAILDAKDDV